MKDQIEKLEKEIERQSKELAQLKELAKQEEFKVGDWVYCFAGHYTSFTKGSIYRVRVTEDECKNLGVEKDDKGSNTNGIPRNNFRKATPSEIESHLIKEAEKKGFVKGARFYNVSKNYPPNRYIEKIQTVKFSYNEDIDTLFVDGNTCYDSGKWAEILPSCPQITINGYKAEFKEWGLDFNNWCAKIHKQVFIELEKSIRTSNSILSNQSASGEHINCNKAITSVTIGTGTFTVDQIKEIAKYYSK